MDYAICTVPAAPVRGEDAHRSEMVNQLLFGETVSVLETRGDWLRIRSLYDDYEGWLTHHLVEAIDESAAKIPLDFIAADLVNVLHTPEGFLHIPMGSILTSFDERTHAVWKDGYAYEGSRRAFAQAFDMEALMTTALLWRNAPYLWGGKTLMGVDCSGFVQTVFKVHGIRLPRDAWQQAEIGEAIGIDAAQPGDLAFFHNEKGRITHVGIVMEGRRLIHASGQVRIDKLDAEGILHMDHGKRTHPLHSLRRVGR